MKTIHLPRHVGGASDTRVGPAQKLPHGWRGSCTKVTVNRRCEMLRFYTLPEKLHISRYGSSRKIWNFQKCTHNLHATCLPLVCHLLKRRTHVTHPTLPSTGLQFGFQHPCRQVARNFHVLWMPGTARHAISVACGLPHETKTPLLGAVEAAGHARLVHGSALGAHATHGAKRWERSARLR